MSLLSIFNSKDDGGEIAVVFDVGSGSVGGAFVYLRKTGKPKIIWNVREPIPFQENLEPEKLQAGMIKTFRAVVARMEREGVLHLNFTGAREKRVKKILCVLSAPWSSSKVKDVKVEKKTPFRISPALIAEILKNEEEDFENSWKDINARGFKEDFEIIESKITESKINGYKVDDPLEREGTVFNASIYLSFSPKEILESLRKEISRFFDLRRIFFHSYSLVASSAIRDLNPNETDWLFADVSGEMTEISFVKGGAIRSSVSFPLGRNFLMRKIMSLKKNCSPENASSLLRMNLDGHLGEGGQDQVLKAVGESRNDWQQMFGSALEDGSEFFIPRKVFITADADCLLAFSDFVSGGSWSWLSGSKGALSSNPITNDITRALAEKKDGLPEDVFVDLEADYLDKMYKAENF